jgi:hypothetical protein
MRVNVKQFALCLSIIAIAAAFWGYVEPTPYATCMAILITLPCLALLAMALVSSDKAKFSLAIIFPSIVLGYRVFHDLNLLAWGRATASALAFAALFVTLIALSARSPRDNWGWFLALWPFLVATYGYGVVLEANMLLDSSIPKHFTASIVDKYRYRDRHYITYRLTLGPWGDITEPKNHFVSSDVFYELSGQSRACIDLGRGAFAVAWYKIKRC